MSIQKLSGLKGLRTHHLGVVVPDVDRAAELYSNMLGLRLLYGPCDDPIQRVRVSFVGTGLDQFCEHEATATIELVAPLDQESPVAAYLERNQAAYHICYEVDDLSAAISSLRQRGCIVVSGPVPAVAFNGRRIAWLFLPTRHLVELLERE